MKRPDMLVLIVVWEFITAFIALIGIAAIATFAFPAVLNNFWGYGYGMMNGNYYGNMPMVGAIFGLSIAILVLLCYIALAVIGGIGILLRHEWGRMVSLVHNALSLICIPFGTIIGTLSIVYLTRQEVKDFFSPPKASPPGSAIPQ